MEKTMTKTVTKTATKTVTKTNLVEAIHAKTGLTKSAAKDFFELVFSTIKENLEAGNSVNVKDFGTFKVRDVKARTGRNPATGDEIQIPACKRATFKASKSMKLD
jgi:putative DNA-binding protein HU-beta